MGAEKPNKQSGQHTSDRRAEERKPSNGTVQLFRQGSADPIPAKLVDSSGHGFRVRLDSGELKPGERVRLRYRWGEVIARVVWLRKAEVTEAGLFVP